MLKTPKMILMEISTKQGKAKPVYKVEHTTGNPNTRLYDIKCTYDEFETIATQQTTIKKGEQFASSKMLDLLGIKHEKEEKIVLSRSQEKTHDNTFSQNEQLKIPEVQTKTKVFNLLRPKKQENPMEETHSLFKTETIHEEKPDIKVTMFIDGDNIRIKDLNSDIIRSHHSIKIFLESGKHLNMPDVEIYHSKSSLKDAVDIKMILFINDYLRIARDDEKIVIVSSDKIFKTFVHELNDSRIELWQTLV
jgi:hypothetical protein